MFLTHYKSLISVVICLLFLLDIAQSLPAHRRRSRVRRVRREEDSLGLTIVKGFFGKYLEKYGFLNESVEGAPPHNVEGLVQAAIKKFQRFVGIKQTGKMDALTQKYMKKKRCGVPDIKALQEDGGVYEQKWEKTHLSWTIVKYTSDLGEDDQREAVKHALGVWSAVTPLEFTEAEGDSADIQVAFASGQHGDPYPFDGPGHVLAHAMFPPVGQMHFDDDEEWTYKDMDKLHNPDYSDLLAVAIHEFGHILGLEHSDNQEAVMGPFYKDQSTNDEYVEPSLTSDDISRIQKLYGSRRGGGGHGRKPPSSGGGGGSHGGDSGGGSGGESGGDGGIVSSVGGWLKKKLRQKLRDSFTSWLNG